MRSKASISRRTANGHGISIDRCYSRGVTGETDPGELCTQCGLCCDGGIFDYGPLSSNEVATARKAGMAVVEADGKAGFLLPCPQLDCAVCKIYELRPKTCRDYRCEILKSVQSGEMEFAEGLERVKEGRAAFDQVSAQLPEGQTITDARKLRREAATAEAAPQLNASPMLMMALSMLDLVLDQHFRRPDQRQVMEME